jgi:CMP-N,N'-diacetyllegionaminic acid synthase
MFEGFSVTAVIPARSGSKGIINKNLQILGRRSLLQMAVDVALDCKFFDRVLVSTDSEDYAEHARQAGAEVPFLRPSELAGDNVKTASAVEDMLKRIGDASDIILLLQPTAPFRGVDDISSALGLLSTRDDANAVISVCEHEEPHPYKLKNISHEGWLEPFMDSNSGGEAARQTLPKVWRLNGAIYAVRRPVFFKEKTFHPVRSLPFVMPAERSVNIDHPLDLLFARYCVESGLVRI